MDFKDVLQQLLDENNMKPVDLCRITGIPTSLMSNYLTGKKSPGVGNSSKIADAFNITMDQISGRESLHADKEKTPESPGELEKYFMEVKKRPPTDDEMETIRSLAKAYIDSLKE